MLDLLGKVREAIRRGLEVGSEIWTGKVSEVRRTYLKGPALEDQNSRVGNRAIKRDCASLDRLARIPTSQRSLDLTGSTMLSTLASLKVIESGYHHSLIDSPSFSST